MKKLDKFIKNKQGEKVELTVTSINILKKHHDFIKEKNVNLSAMIRELIDQLIEEDKQDSIKAL